MLSENILSYVNSTIVQEEIVGWPPVQIGYKISVSVNMLFAPWSTRLNIIVYVNNESCHNRLISFLLSSRRDSLTS